MNIIESKLKEYFSNLDEIKKIYLNVKMSF